MKENQFSDSGKGAIGLGFGICYHSIVPLRAEASHKSELTSQLLFGEHYKILKKSADDQWVYIENGFDGYNAWMDFKQHKPITQQYYEIVDSMSWPISKDLLGLVHWSNKVFPLLYGSVLPIYNNGVIIIEKDAGKYQGEVFYPTVSTDFNFLYSAARFYLSAPYLWGGRTPFGIDCSGFVQQVFRICGFKLPRDAKVQAEEGISISPNEIKPGDLAFFADDNNVIMHVGIICEHNNIIHASGEVRIDKVDEKGIFNEEYGRYTHKRPSFKRIF